MAFDINMIKKLYESYPNSIKKTRAIINKNLTLLKFEGEDYLIMKESDILAIIK